MDTDRSVYKENKSRSDDTHQSESVENPANRVLMGVGLSETNPGFGPAGALRATKFAPGEFVEPSVAARQWVLSPPLWQNKKTPKFGVFYFWRRGWDSNPRRATNPCWFSSLSTRTFEQLLHA